MRLQSVFYYYKVCCNHFNEHLRFLVSFSLVTDFAKLNRRLVALPIDISEPFTLTAQFSVFLNTAKTSLTNKFNLSKIPLSPDLEISN